MIKLFGFLKKHLFTIILSVVLIFIQVMSNLSLPRLMSEIINKGVMINDIPMIWRTGGYMILITAVGGISVVIASFLLSRISASFGVDLRRAVFTKLTYASLEQIGEFGTSTLVTRTTNDINQLQQFIVISRMLIMAPLMGIGGIIMAIYEAPTLSYIVFIVLALLIAIIGSAMFLVVPKFKALQQKLDYLTLVLREYLTGLRVIKAFNKNKIELDRFGVANEDLAITTLKITRIMVFLIPSMMFIMNASAILIIWVGGRQIQTSGVEIGSIMAFMQYVTQVLFSFLMMAMIFTFIPRAQVSANRIVDVLKSQNTITQPDNIIAPPVVKESTLEFLDATFRYTGAQEPVLKNISFKAKSGEIVAIIGGTGSGKTTLIDLIPRFYDIETGHIFVDGLDVRSYDLKDLREKIALVPQKPVIFSGTVSDNIRYGRDDASEDDVKRAARIAQAEEFINNLDDGFDTPIAQGGTDISGGQKQRLSIARAIARNPEIFIFDDSFSALDYKTDAMLRQAIRKELKNKIIIIVAQRVTSIINADQIIVLDNGEIVGIGKHKDLYANNQTYKEIVLSQMEEGEVA
ncbi:MAG: ATP-binding cassette subfamily B bacterial [Fusobacteria bacterium]|nr:MAG: ATP-binding cassette subfamily B bacterial [Fusobacteriota bacterium]KAF0229010.1 MAG: ATP-binding cassette subfamily B [Fusobacteriota bacterium]